MTFDHIHNEEARHTGEPESESVADLAGIAPPCDECGRRESVTTTSRGKRLCRKCASDDTDADADADATDEAADPSTSDATDT